MRMQRTFPLLMLAALLPGCAWFGGDGGAEASEGDGPAFVVVVHNSGGHPTQVKLEVLEGELLLHEDSYEVGAGSTEERRVAYDQNGTKQIRVTYSVDAGGQAAAGSQEHSFDPATCAGTYRVTFEVRPDEQLTFVGNHGECDARQ